MFVILVSTVSAQQPAWSFCEAQNPLVRMLKRNGVTVHDQPQQNTASTCTAEWNPHRTCCEAHSLVQYAEKDIKRVNKAIKNVKEDVVALMKFVRKFEEEIEDAIKRSNMKKADKKDYVDELNKDLKSFKKELDSLLDDDKDNNEDKDKCFDRIKEIRTNSLCYTCSGRSSNFFLQGLALMRLGECKSTVKKCGKTWKRSIDLLDAIVLAKKIRKQLKIVIPKDDLIDFEENHIDKLQEWIGGKHIRQPVKDCASKNGVCTDESAKLLCETFISLRKADFLQEVGSLMAGNQRPGTLGNASPVSAQTSAWVIGAGRILQYGGGRYGPDTLTTGHLPSITVVSDESAAPSYMGEQFKGMGP